MKIESTSSVKNKNVKIIVYGKAGVGKTYLASTIKDCLIVSAEGGLLTLHGHNIHYVNINDVPRKERIDKLVEVYKYISTAEAKKKYKWLFLDSVTEISQLLLENAKEIYPTKKDSFNRYDYHDDKLMSLMKSFRDLEHYNVVFTALPKFSEDRNQVQHCKLDIPSCGKRIPGLFDYVFYMYSDTEGKRKFMTNENATTDTKQRGNFVDPIEDADLGLIYGKIMGGKNEGV